MNMPGFNAEASLYRTSAENYMVTGAIFAASTARVVPQGDPCRGACRCCSEYGYQGCCSICDDCFVRHPTETGPATILAPR